MDAEKAVADWALWRQVSTLVKLKVITEEQAETLKTELNKKLHEDLDIDEE